MPSLGAPEIIIILVIALLVFGPRRLPEMGRSLGRAVREFKKASDTARKEFGVDEIEREIKDVKTTLGGVKGDLKIDIDAETAKPSTGQPAAVAAGAAAGVAAGVGADGEATAELDTADAAAAADVGEPDGPEDAVGEPPATGDEAEGEILVGEVVDDEAPAAVGDAGPSGA
jgi:sec-independent protein translocase protein TatA